jgi:hypothetical protein
VAIVRGDKLTADTRAEVLRVFVHRWTHENSRQTYRGKCPACAQHRGADTINGKTWHEYHAPIVTDAEWLRAHAFTVRQNGQLDRRTRHAHPAYLADDREDRS